MRVELYLISNLTSSRWRGTPIYRLVQSRGKLVNIWRSHRRACELPRGQPGGQPRLAWGLVASACRPAWGSAKAGLGAGRLCAPASLGASLGWAVGWSPLRAGQPGGQPRLGCGLAGPSSAVFFRIFVHACPSFFSFVLALSPPLPCVHLGWS